MSVLNNNTKGRVVFIAGSGYGAHLKDATVDELVDAAGEWERDSLSGDYENPQAVKAWSETLLNMACQREREGSNQF